MSGTMLIRFPEARRQLGMGENRALKRACTRHSIPWVRLNSRVLALRKSDLEIFGFQVRTEGNSMTTDVTKIKHIAGPLAVAIGAAIRTAFSRQPQSGFLSKPSAA
jgi:hypothetical protein